MIKKIKNNADTLIEDIISGYVLSYPDILEQLGPRSIVRRQKKTKGKVKLVSGGGSGHEPGGRGFIGPGLLDMGLVGDIFSAPSGGQMFKAIKSIDDGSPVFQIVYNHAGDIMNADITKQLAKANNIDWHIGIFYDDVASAPKERANERRGIGGGCVVNKICGGAAELDEPIDEVIRIFNKARDSLRSYAVALTECTHPITGQKIISLPDNVIEMGMGVHGEAGSNRSTMKTSKEFAKIVSDILLEDMPLEEGTEVVVFLNGMGSLTTMEISVLYNDVYHYLTGQKKLVIHDVLTGNISTTLELSGFSLTICQIDKELKRFWDEPCRSPVMTRLRRE
jgi:dihydroxyacetone kinase